MKEKSSTGSFIITMAKMCPSKAFKLQMIQWSSSCNISNCRYVSLQVCQCNCVSVDRALSESTMIRKKMFLINRNQTALPKTLQELKTRICRERLWEQVVYRIKLKSDPVSYFFLKAVQAWICLHLTNNFIEFVCLHGFPPTV